MCKTYSVVAAEEALEEALDSRSLVAQEVARKLQLSVVLLVVLETESLMALMVEWDRRLPVALANRTGTSLSDLYRSWSS